MAVDALVIADEHDNNRSIDLFLRQNAVREKLRLNSWDEFTEMDLPEGIVLGLSVIPQNKDWEKLISQSGKQIAWILFDGDQACFLDSCTQNLSPERVEGWLDTFNEGMVRGTERPYIFVKSEARIHRVDLDDLYYVEAQKDYVKVHTQSGSYTVLNSMKNFLSRLPDRDFMRVHRSFIVRLDKIETLTGDQIATKVGKLQVGPSFRSQLLQRMDIV